MGCLGRSLVVCEIAARNTGLKLAAQSAFQGLKLRQQFSAQRSAAWAGQPLFEFGQSQGCWFAHGSTWYQCTPAALPLEHHAACINGHEAPALMFTANQQLCTAIKHHIRRWAADHGTQAKR